jgi:glycosyltransferase involved in cell wall biosynthesis
MRILMILSSQIFPPDRRVERESRDLIRAGHEVHLVARRGPSQAAREDVAGVHVERVWLPFQGRGILCDLAYYAGQRYWIIATLLKLCRRHRIEALHVHDLPYALAATVVGRWLRIPVIFDMHEHYTAMLRMGFETPPHRRFRTLAAPLLGLLGVEERIACRSAHAVIIVADEHRARVAGCGAPPDRIHVVTNTEDPDQFAGLPLDPAIAQRYADTTMILYIGVMNAHRGLETAIDALPRVIERIPNTRLVLIGDGPSRPGLQRRVAKRGLGDAVDFPGYQPFKSLPSYVNACAAGLIPHVSTPHTETTMPNKIFQYMILGRPVVVSNLRPLQRVIDDAQCGVSFQERDADSLAAALIRLHDADLRRQLGENGRAAVATRYNWPQTVATLLDLYADLARRQGAAPSPIAAAPVSPPR